MTREQDIERVLDQWLVDGPTQMPSRFLDDTLDRIDRAPQRRLAGLRPRLLAMNPSLRLAAAAALILVIAGIGMTVIHQGPAAGVSPSTSPTVPPSSTVGPPASAQTITDIGPLESKWISMTPRHWPGPTIASGPFLITIGSKDMVINNFKGDVFSTIALAGTDSVRLTLQNAVQYWDCHPGDEGRYTIGLSSAGDTLSLTPVTDPCATRSFILSGEWARSNCPNDGLCLGDLQPGRHVSAYFHAYLAAPDQLVYVVPDGWSNTTDGPTYVLTKRNAKPTTGIVLFSGVFPQSQTDDCVAATSKFADRSAKTLAGWLSTLPGLVTTEPTPINVGALTGFVVDVSIAPGWTQTCGNAQGQPVVNTFTSADMPDPSYRVTLVGSAQARYVLLDLSDGNTLLIDVEAPDKATWDALMPEAMPIVESFRFMH